MSIEYDLYDVPTITVDKKKDSHWLWDFKAKTNGNGSRDHLDTSETVTSLTIVAPTGVTAGTQNIINSNTSVQQWFSFADATVGEDYTVEASLVTSDGRKDEFPIIFHVIDAG